MQKVTAGIIEKDGKILIAKRKNGKCLGPRWEFPGGKLEAGETPEECLKRELKEELNIETQIGEFVTTSQFTCSDISIELLAYKVTFISGEIIPVDHDEVKWVLPEELTKYDFVKADITIVNKLLNDIYNINS